MILFGVDYKKAVPHFLDAIATFGRPGENLYDVARAISAASKLHDFSQDERRRLLESLEFYIGRLRYEKVDPLSFGKKVSPSSALFGPDRLGGLFRSVNAAPSEVNEDLFAVAEAKSVATDQSLIDQLIQQTNLYSTSKSFTDLLAFVARMRGFAPFNAMLLHAQKPGITHAATAADWLTRFNRKPKEDARPLIVMQAMGPVGFVFDVLDTEGDDLPPEAFAFPTFGALSQARWDEMLASVGRAKIEILWVDKGDGAAGSMTRTEGIVKGKPRARWTVRVNQNHPPATQFVTMAHELAHMFLGHLGGDDTQSIKARKGLGHDLEEVEAEAVAWVVAHRNGLKPKSEAYLDRYKKAFNGLEVGTILKAANAVETAMGISAAQLAKVGGTK